MHEIWIHYKTASKFISDELCYVHKKSHLMRKDMCRIHTNRRVRGRMTWMYASFCQELIILPGTCIWSLDTYFNLFIIYNLYVSFVKLSYQARFCLQISYPEILFTMLMGFLNGGSFIVHALLPVTSKVFTLSAFLPGAHWHIHVLLLGTQRNASKTLCLIPISLTLLYTSIYYFLLRDLNSLYIQNNLHQNIIAL